MSSTRPDRATDELSTRARILAAALRRFATEGLGAPLRAIATDANVSPGLIIHHFGSADQLREACDQHVLAETTRTKTDLLAPDAGAAAMLTQLAQLEEYTPLIGYVLRRLQAGGPQARQLIDGFVADTTNYLRQAEEAGTVTPSRDPEARARLLTEQGLGALLLQLPAQKEPLELVDLPAQLKDYTARIITPVLELYTEPLLTDPTLLHTYLAATHHQEGT